MLELKTTEEYFLWKLDFFTFSLEREMVKVSVLQQKSLRKVQFSLKNVADLHSVCSEYASDVSIEIRLSY